jgi:hypothetical protein
MDGCAFSVLFPANYGIRRVVAMLHFSEYRLRARGRSRWALAHAECHDYQIVLSNGKLLGVLNISPAHTIATEYLAYHRDHINRMKTE